MFTLEEICLMQSAVETYNERDRGVLNYELQNSLSRSCLSKFDNYNALTYFSKQELTLIAMAINHLIENLVALPTYSYVPKLLEDLEALFDRLCTLAR